jgi:ribonuclease HI
MEWHIFVDGAASGNPGPAGAGILILDDKANELDRRSIFLGEMTNNMAEYEALVRALDLAREADVRWVRVYSDSELVVNHVSGRYKVRNERLKRYVEAVSLARRQFEGFALQYIPREKNTVADRLAKDAVKRRGRRVTAPFDGEESPGIEGQDGP